MSIFSPSSYTLNPVSLALGAINYAGQRSQAKAQAEANQRAAESARQSRDNQIAQLSQQYIQQAEDMANNRMEMQLENLRRRERARTAAGEAGIAGNSFSVTALLNDFERTDAKTQFNAMQRLENAGAQVLAQQEGIHSQFVGRVLGLAPVNAPNPLMIPMGAIEYKG